MGNAALNAGVKGLIDVVEHPVDTAVRVADRCLNFLFEIVGDLTPEVVQNAAGQGIHGVLDILDRRLSVKESVRERVSVEDL